MPTKDSNQQLRSTLVNTVLIPGGIYDYRVLQAMRDIPRHRFLQASQKAVAYQNQAMPIGYHQVMLAPLLIAKILQTLAFDSTENILEVGTGTGYLTALLAELGHYVFSLERIMPLADHAGETLHRMGCQQVDLHIGDGSQGLADMAPFDVIVVTASVWHIPRPLAMQLSPLGGRMIIPVREKNEQTLQFVRREGKHWRVRKITRSQLAPLIGRYGVISPDIPSNTGI